MFGSGRARRAGTRLPGHVQARSRSSPCRTPPGAEPRSATAASTALRVGSAAGAASIPRGRRGRGGGDGEWEVWVLFLYLVLCSSWGSSRLAPRSALERGEKGLCGGFPKSRGERDSLPPGTRDSAATRFNLPDPQKGEFLAPTRPPATRPRAGTGEPRRRSRLEPRAPPLPALTGGRAGVCVAAQSPGAGERGGAAVSAGSQPAAGGLQPGGAHQQPVLPQAGQHHQSLRGHGEPAPASFGEWGGRTGQPMGELLRASVSPWAPPPRWGGGGVGMWGTSI